MCDLFDGGGDIERGPRVLEGRRLVEPVLGLLGVLGDLERGERGGGTRTGLC